MRDRHNIVGSEVGRPRPLYLDRMAKLGVKRGALNRVWLLLGSLILTLILIIAVWVQRG